MLRRTIALLVVMVGVVLGLAGTASAHPLGNFTVNHYAGIELAGDRVFVRFVLDLAEIPTLQSGDEVRAAGYSAAAARRLELRLDGTVTPLRVVRHRVSERKGAAGLPTLRFEAIYAAPLHGSELRFVDATFAERIGWREITVVARDGARVVDASVPERSRSNALRAYPNELLSSPLDVRTASARFVAGTVAARPPGLDAPPAPVHTGRGFEALIERRDLSLGVILVSLLVAAFWGAAHALTPGHGKALVAGYLVGTRGRPRHAFLLGATVTITHTAGVFALGLVTLLLSQFVVPERLYPWLTLVSGLLVVGVGLGVLRSRLRRGAWHGHDHGVGFQSDTFSHADTAHHDEHHHHAHDHGHQHSHGVRPKSDTTGSTDLTSRGLLGVGIAAGLLPCPSALVVLLSAIALHRVGFGLALIVAFSLGLAATITGIGLVALLARRAFARARFDGPMIRALPAVSAAVIVLVGFAITVKALPGVM